VFANVGSVLGQCNARPRLLHLLYDIDVVWRKAIKHAISMFYTVIKHGFLTNESVRQVPSIIIIIMSYTLDSNLTIIFFQWVVLSTH